MAGRKQRNTVEYFPHYVRDSKTKAILKNKFGLEGYAIWFQLLEILCKSKDHYCDLRDEINYEWLLSEIGTEKETFENVIDFLVRVGKIDMDLWQNKIIWCQNLVDNLERVYQKRVSEIPQKPLFLIPKCPNSDKSGTEIDKSGTEITQSKVKRSTVKNSTVKMLSDSEETNPPEQTPAEIARRFFKAWKEPKLRGEQFNKYAERLNSELDNFCSYWTEPTKSGKKVKWEKCDTWELGRRIGTWLSNADRRSNGRPQRKQIDEERMLKILKGEISGYGDD